MPYQSEPVPLGQKTKSQYGCSIIPGSLNSAKLLALSVFSLATSLLLLMHCRLHPVFLERHTLLSCCGKRTVRVVLEDDIGVDRAGNYSSERSVDGHHRRWKAQARRRRLPACLIIGVRKGGTRALLEFLSLHPFVQAEKQEVHFFDDDENYSRGLEWYRKKMHYSKSSQITIEKTPAYFVGERVPGRVYAMNRTIRLIVTVRDPIERAISDYMQIHSSRLDHGKYHASFEELVIDAATGEINAFYKPIRRSIYHRHLERWLRFFPLEQFHFVNSESLVRNPTEELRKVERFLGIEHRLDDTLFYFNKTRGFFCMRVNAATDKCLASSKGRTHPRINRRVLEKLRKFFRPHNRRFYDMMGVNFDWF